MRSEESHGDESTGGSFSKEEKPLSCGSLFLACLGSLDFQEVDH